MSNDSGTLVSYEPQPLRLCKHGLNFSQRHMHYALRVESRADENEFMLVLITSAKNVFLSRGI